MMITTRSLLVLLLASVAAALGSCAAESARGPGETAGDGVDGGPHVIPGSPDEPALGPCRQSHAESFPARLVTMSADAGAVADDVIFIDDLVQRFQSACGACHGPTVAALGGFQITSRVDFEAKMNADVLGHVTSNGGPNEPTLMPPVGSATSKPFRDRGTNDPIRDLAVLVQAWLDAGRPGSFTRPGTSATAGAESADFTLTVAGGNAMTNIGTCIPSAGLYGLEKDNSEKLDAMFASAQRAAPGTDATVAEKLGLPQHLSDTDLFTLDTKTLATYGVIAYAPAYPLWSDGAGKLRYVRVPRGTSIHFDKATQRFQAPPNTRFYKTFMKPVTEADCSIRWKKMETRIIVSRPNPADDDDTINPPSLFGTYRWNDAETDAELVQTLLRSGEPFADTVVQYVSDEPLAANILAGKPVDTNEALLEGHAARHYAIPSSQRCFECHRGSPSRDFVLGFNPLQITRRPVGSGGVIEAASADELSQLQRFIDYGLVTGIDSLDDVLPLEASEGSRPPRNDRELVAQGYMLGNCAHCHNPHGDPTVVNPVLKGVLDFLPSAEGGIFQFPLDRVSPRITRGVSSPVAIPYITPSLLDYPEATPLGTDGQLVAGSVSPESTFITSAIYAPWRSLIYRNVDSAFSYTNDQALYPHMPRNTAGYDIRARQILSDWMVSIPAKRTNAAVPEYALVPSVVSPLFLDNLPQPYTEVKPGDLGYADAVSDAAARLETLHSGVNPALPLGKDILPYSRYSDPTDTFDILDPAVVRDPVCHPVPVPVPATPDNPYPYARHANWVVRDLTDPPGAWAPRRSDWPDALVGSKPEVISGGSCVAPNEAVAAREDERIAVKLLQDPNARLDSIRAFATTKVPFGLWTAKPQCNFAGVPTVGSIAAAGDAPHWVARSASLPSSAPVYSQTPGATVFKMICINCHGPLADSTGRFAANLAEMTGGSARVANFRRGLFGPEGNPGQNLQEEFSSRLPEAWNGIPAEDVAARYMAWMALGGTKATIPQNLLGLVGATKVLGTQRKAALAGSANMLSNAKQICLSLLGPAEPQTSQYTRVVGFDFYPLGFEQKSIEAGYFGVPNDRLIASNGDAEMWLKMCTIGNPSPVHVIRLEVAAAPGAPAGAPLQTKLYMDKVLENSGAPRTDADLPLLAAGSYLGVSESRACQVDTDCASIASSARCDVAAGKCSLPVGNVAGGVDDSLNAANAWPWCVVSVKGPEVPGLPYCPKGVATMPVEDANAWSVRGAVNAGFSVFTYLEWLVAHAPEPDYDQCESLAPPTATRTRPVSRSH